MKLSLLVPMGALALAIAACDDEGTIVPKTDAGSSAQPSTSGSAAPPASLIESGRQFVLQRDCAKCHDSPDMPGLLAGNATPIAGTTAYAANLTPDPDTGIDSWTDDAYAAAMRKGVDDEGVTLCTSMPRFSDMKDDEASAIAAYLRSLAPIHHYVPESTCAEKTTPPDAGSTSDAAGDAAAE